MSKKFCINDEVIIIVGKDKGKRGIIRSIKKDKVIVSGVNYIYKNIKSLPKKNIIGGIIKKESWIHISNISHFILNNKNKIILSKIGFKYLNNKKIRFLKYNNLVINK